MTTSNSINLRLNGPSPMDIERAVSFHWYGVDDAILIASVAASAAGTGASMAASEKASSAQQHQANLELLRQKEFQKKAQGVVDESLALSTRELADQQIAAGANTRLAGYQKVGGLSAPSAAAPNQMATQSGSSSASRAAESASSAKQLASAWNKIVAPSQARMGGYGDWGLKQEQKNSRAQERISTESSAARGSLRVSQHDQARALHSGDSLAGIGSALSAAGAVGGMYAGTRTSAPSKAKSPPNYYVTQGPSGVMMRKNGWPVQPQY